MSRDLVEISDIKPGMTVIDLAARGGVTTQKIITVTTGNVRVIVIDQAEGMLKKAEEKFHNLKNIQYVVAEVERLNNAINEVVDAVVCNSAFWQMRVKETFMAVSEVLKLNGIFAFNMPDPFFNRYY